MKNYIFILLIMAFTSCDDFLDVKPVGKLIPSKIEELDLLLNNSALYNWDFLDNNQGCHLAMLTDNFEFSETVFESEMNISNSIINRLLAYKFKTPYSDPRSVDYYWDWGTYKPVYYYNNIIANVKDMLSQDVDYGKSIIAQAKAARAIVFLNAAMTYGPAYVPKQANDSKTICYRTSPIVTVKNPALSTTDEIFNYIEKDLLDALVDIPDYSSTIRYNKITVKTALAYFYMFKGDFPKMLEFSNAAWEDALQQKGSIENLIYDFNKFAYVDNGVTPIPGADPETEQTLQYDNNSDNGNYALTTNNEVLLYRRSARMTSMSYSSQEFINLFSDKDVRGHLFLLYDKGYTNSNGKDDGIILKYYRAKKIGNGNTTGFSYPELLLMRAEAYARNNQNAAALNDLNQLRLFRYENNVIPLNNLSGDDLLHEILLERRRELITPSYKRFLDIKRFNAYDDGKPWAKSKIRHELMTYTAQNNGPSIFKPSGIVFEAEVNSNKFILPISNPVLLLNPEWGIQTNEQPYLID